MPAEARKAARAAMRALSDLDIDSSRPIDPFEAINRLQIELHFHPLSDLLGVIIPGDNPGILINSDRPASVQRFTAAHEIGHWYLHQDDLAMDGREEIEGNPRSPREREAQVFASHFLMPLDLLYRTAFAHGIRKGGDVTPTSVYELARDMHVSYQAGVRQLFNCGFITTRMRAQLLKVQPSTAKKSLTDGRKPANPRGDVWLLKDVGDGSVDVDVLVGDEIVVALAENPSTGYFWKCSIVSSEQVTLPSLNISSSEPGQERVAAAKWPVGVEPAPTLVEVANDIDTFPRTEVSVVRVGAPVHRRVGFSAISPGHAMLKFNYLRPFSDSAPVRSLTVKATIRAMPAVEQRQRVLRDFVLSEGDVVIGPVQ